jgi:hypothetical protein
MKKFVLVAIFTLLLLLAILVYLPTPVAAERINVTITMDDDLVYAESGGNITATGRVSVNVNNLGENTEDVVVEIKVDAGGWVWSVSPEQLVFVVDYNSKAFAVSIDVPKEHDVLYEREIYVSADVTVHPVPVAYDLQEDNFTLKVKPRVDYMVYKSVETVDIYLNDEVTIEYEVYNNGDITDLVTPTLFDTENTIISNTFTYSFDRESFNVDPGTREKVVLTLTSPESAAHVQNENFVIHLGVTSEWAVELGMWDEWYEEINIRVTMEQNPYSDDDDDDDDVGDDDSVGGDTPAFELSLLVLSLFILILLNQFVLKRHH